MFPRAANGQKLFPRLRAPLVYDAWPCSRVKPLEARENEVPFWFRLTWLEPAIQSKPVKPSIWLRDTGQRIRCFDSCQWTMTLMSNIKDVYCKLS